jgi:hypothetical protein
LSRNAYKAVIPSLSRDRSLTIDAATIVQSALKAGVRGTVAFRIEKMDRSD